MDGGVTYDLRIGLRTTLAKMVIMTIVLGMAGAAYFIGYGQLRFSAVPPDEPIKYFTFWLFFITGYLPFVVYMGVLYLLFTSALRQRRPSRILPYVLGFLAAAAVAWALFFVIWQAVVWANCNDGGNTLIPAHPECINRNYPAEQSADWTFIIQVISGGILAFPSLMGALICMNVIDTELAAYTLATSEGEYINEDIECHYKRGDRKRKDASRKRSKQAVSSSSKDSRTSGNQNEEEDDVSNTIGWHMTPQSDSD